jgi:succinoglycan biosynthesis protein ExoA
VSETQQVQLSIIVACRNEIRHIHSFLDSLLSQDMTDLSWEAVIADGRSDDGSREVLRDYATRCSQLNVIDNAGLIVSTGLNAAIRAARGTIILRMDAHTRYGSNYCRQCVETLERTRADNVGGPARTQAVGRRARAIAAAFHSRFSTGGAKFHDVNYEGWVDTVPYGCWRKTTLENIGLFDETLVRNQDDELNLRLLRAGGKIWQSPAIVSWYSPRSRMSNLFRQYFQYGFWKVAVIRKHRLPSSWRHAVPVAFILANAILFASMAVSAARGNLRGLSVAATLWLALATSYLGISLSASVFAARRHGWGTFPYLPAVFAVYHFSYGLGFLLGSVQLLSKSDRNSLVVAESPLTKITR